MTNYNEGEFLSYALDYDPEFGAKSIVNEVNEIAGEHVDLTLSPLDVVMLAHLSDKIERQRQAVQQRTPTQVRDNMRGAIAEYRRHEVEAAPIRNKFDDWAAHKLESAQKSARLMGWLIIALGVVVVVALAVWMGGKI